MLEAAVAGEVRSTTMTMAARGEVDTSSPIESVKEAVVRFGGGAWGGGAATWRAPPLQLGPEEIELMKVEEQTVKLEMELFVKERDTFKLLKEVEIAKQAIDSLNFQLENEIAGVTNGTQVYGDFMKAHPFPDAEQRRNSFSNDHMEPFVQSTNRKKSPVTTLMELKQAKAYLNKNTVEVLKSKIEEEKLSLETTRERIRFNTAKASSLKQDLSKAVAELQAVKSSKSTILRINGAKPVVSQESSDMLLQMKQAESEKEKYEKMTKNYEFEICQLTAEIEVTKCGMKTMEFKILMTEKLKEASKSGEALALAELKKPRNGPEPSTATSEVTLSSEEHTTLTRKAQEADLNHRKKMEAAMLQLDDANLSKLDLLERVEEAMACVESSRKALKDAVKREEAALEAKLTAEATLRKLQSEQGKIRRSVQNSARFKKSATTPRKGGPGILDVNGMSLMGNKLKNTKSLSIGQILSRKLTGLESESGKHTNGKQKVTLAQILSNKFENPPLRTDDGTAHKQLPTRNKKLGFSVFSLVAAKQQKKQAYNP